MGLETGTYLNDLVSSNPVGAADFISAGDNHIRLLKSLLKNTFPGIAFPVGKCTFTGTNTLAGSLSPAPSSLIDGMVVWGKNTTANTSTTVTLNLNSLGSKNVRRYHNKKLEIGDLGANQTVMFVFNATDDVFELLSLPATLRKHNYSASTAPTVNSDSTAGYEVGSLWVDTTAAKVYVCVDASTGAAVWSQVSTNVLDEDDMASDDDTLPPSQQSTKRYIKGHVVQIFDNGTKSTGTFTPAVSSGFFQKAVNGGAHTLGAMTELGAVLLLYTNNATAGALDITAYGDNVYGDTLDTTDGNVFELLITNINGTAWLQITASKDNT